MDVAVEIVTDFMKTGVFFFFRVCMMSDLTDDLTDRPTAGWSNW